MAVYWVERLELTTADVTAARSVSLTVDSKENLTAVEMAALTDDYWVFQMAMRWVENLAVLTAACWAGGLVANSAGATDKSLVAK
jgi:hypothetical protein